jgi:hypothetical protein
VLFPAIVSLVSGLWALAEWRDHRVVEDPDVAGIDNHVREAREASRAGRAAHNEKETGWPTRSAAVAAAIGSADAPPGQVLTAGASRAEP